MAGEMLIINGSPCFIDYEDGEGSAIVNGSEWRWTFREWGGPTFLKKDGEMKKCQCPTNKKVWAAFYVWLLEYYREKKDEKGMENVEKILKEDYGN